MTAPGFRDINDASGSPRTRPSYGAPSGCDASELSAARRPSRRLMSSLDACLMGDVALGVHRYQCELAIVIEFEQPSSPVGIIPQQLLVFSAWHRVRPHNPGTIDISVIVHPLFFKKGLLVTNEHK